MFKSWKIIRVDFVALLFPCFLKGFAPAFGETPYQVCAMFGKKEYFPRGCALGLWEFEWGSLGLTNKMGDKIH